jgi:hypothetical protein
VAQVGVGTLVQEDVERPPGDRPRRYDLLRLAALDVLDPVPLREVARTDAWNRSAAALAAARSSAPDRPGEAPPFSLACGGVPERAVRPSLI